MLATYEAHLCPCGCGQWADECLDPTNEGRYAVSVERCYARAALAEHARDDDKPPAGQLLSVRLVSDDETALLEFDPDRALAEFEAHQARYQPPDH